jgi:hypothetical protein
VTWCLSGLYQDTQKNPQHRIRDCFGIRAIPVINPPQMPGLENCAAGR